jgi:hypothetical protein
MKTATKTETKERPILFSAPMVKAILKGEKTQTRRIVKTPKSFGEFIDVFDDDYLAQYGFIAIDTSLGHGFKVRCPYGKVGDRLWVRETFYCNDYRYPDAAPIDELKESLDYKANHESDCDCFFEGSAWRPSIHMPRWASRISLEITNIRTERLHQISEADAIAEGVDAVSMADVPRQATTSHRADFKQLWDKINGADSWDKSPWVWLIEFKKI